MSDLFNKMIDRVLASEGGYVNHPNDPGGETQWGISKRSYPELDIKSLTREDAKAIYRRDFWDRAHCDELHEDVSFQVLDFAVNSGCETAIRYMQRAAGVADDGHFGEITLSAIREIPPPVFVLIFLALRLKFMTTLNNWPTFAKGWSRRIADNMLYAAEDIST